VGVPAPAGVGCHAVKVDVFATRHTRLQHVVRVKRFAVPCAVIPNSFLINLQASTVGLELHAMGSRGAAAGGSALFPMLPSTSSSRCVMQLQGSAQLQAPFATELH